MFIFTYCKKEATPPPPPTQQEKNKAKIKGKWQFVSFTDSSRKTFTNVIECWANNTLELRDNHTAVISQGPCIEASLKARVQNYAPKFTILAATPAYLKQTGYTKDAMIGKGV